MRSVSSRACVDPGILEEPLVVNEGDDGELGGGGVERGPDEAVNLPVSVL